MWKDIPGYEGLYKINTSGTVRSYDRYCKYKEKLSNGSEGHWLQEKDMKPFLNTNGYWYVSLVNSKSVRKKIAIHRLLAICFLDNSNNRPTVNHKDGDKQNNSLSNLEWASRKGQTIHALKNNLHSSKLTKEDVLEIKHKLNLGYKGVILAKEYNISTAVISLIKNNKSWYHI